MYAVQKLITEKLEKLGIMVLSAYRDKSNDGTAQNDTIIAKLGHMSRELTAYVQQVSGRVQMSTLR